MAGRQKLWLIAAILLLSAVAWAATVLLMGSMTMPDMEAGASDGAIFFGLWVLMMAAMMLPSALPMFTLYGRMQDSRPAGFVGGYLVVWATAGLVAYATYAVVRGGALAMAQMRGIERPAAIALISLAALYQLTPLKNVCLRHCRSPLAFVLNHWRPGAAGALRMGLEHGSWCLGCCAGLMLLLFAVGVMNVGWMALLALVILAEKTLPGGLWIARGVAVSMIALAVTFAVNPDFYGMVTGQASM